MKVRFAEPHEAELCNALNNELYGVERPLDTWRWDFQSGLFEDPTLPFVVIDDGGRIVGTQALIPVRMIDAKGVFWTAKSEETLLHPDYRGKKLFEQMYALLFDYARERELLVIWGFTPALRAFDRLGFESPFKTSQLVFPFESGAGAALTRESPSAARRLLLAAGSGAAGLASSARLALRGGSVRAAAERCGLRLEDLERPPKQAAALSERFIELWGGATIYRDDRYLQWRLYDNPHARSLVRGCFHNDHLVGWCGVALSPSRVAHLVEIFVAPADDDARETAELAVEHLLRDAVVRCRRMGALALRAWRVNQHPFDRVVSSAASRIGFYPIQQGSPMVFFDCGARERGGSVASYGDWYISRIFTEGGLG